MAKTKGAAQTLGQNQRGIWSLLCPEGSHSKKSQIQFYLTRLTSRVRLTSTHGLIKEACPFSSINSIYLSIYCYTQYLVFNNNIKNIQGTGTHITYYQEKKNQ